MTHDEFTAAVATLGAKDMTKGGEPKMKALNKALSDAGLPAITKDERDAMLAVEGSDDGMCEVTVTDASCDPVPCYSHADRKVYRLRIGEPQRVPAEVVEALKNSNHVTFVKGA